MPRATRWTESLARGLGCASRSLPWGPFAYEFPLQGLPQTSTDLLVPFDHLDYGTVYNVTDDAGALLERRYLGEDRFVVLAARVYYGAGFGEEATQVRLLPRPLLPVGAISPLNGTDGLVPPRGRRLLGVERRPS